VIIATKEKNREMVKESGLLIMKQSKGYRGLSVDCVARMSCDPREPARNEGMSQILMRGSGDESLECQRSPTFHWAVPTAYQGSQG
jgi:hypothetical protein